MNVISMHTILVARIEVNIKHDWKSWLRRHVPNETRKWETDQRIPWKMLKHLLCSPARHLVHMRLVPLLHTLQRWLLCDATLKWPMPSNLTLAGMRCTTGMARAVGIGKALRIRYTFTICRLKFKRSNGSVVYALDLLYKSQEFCTATSKVCTNKGQYHFFDRIPTRYLLTFWSARSTPPILALYTLTRFGCGIRMCRLSCLE